VRSALWTFRGKRLAVFGLAFKGGTDDVRESPAFDIIRMLLAEACTVVAYDPAATERAKARTPPGPSMQYADDPYAAVNGATRYSSSATGLSLRTRSRQAADCAALPIVIDGRNLYDPQEMLEHGFTYLSVGRPADDPAKEKAGARRVALWKTRSAATLVRGAAPFEEDANPGHGCAGFLGSH